MLRTNPHLPSVFVATLDERLVTIRWRKSKCPWGRSLRRYGSRLQTSTLLQRSNSFSWRAESRYLKWKENDATQRFNSRQSCSPGPVGSHGHHADRVGCVGRLGVSYPSLDPRAAGLLGDD